MLKANGKYQCDAELGSPGRWRGCRKRAVIQRDAKLVTMHYCRDHRERAISPQNHHFTPAPGSKPLPIIEGTSDAAS